MRKVRRFILLTGILVGLGGVGYKVADTLVANAAREIRQKPLAVLDYLPEAALRMKDFHRAKIEDGRKVWELFGDEAHYSKEKKEAVIKNPKFYYYDKDGHTTETIGAEARLFLTDTELEKMQLQGGIRVTYQGYVLHSDEAVYTPADDQIVFPGKVTMAGEGVELEGSNMEVTLGDQKIRLQRNVKTKLEPATLAKRKNRAENG